MTRNSNKKKNKTILKLASYGTAKVYKTNQVRLKSSLLNTLGIRPGDYVEMFLDTEEGVVVIKSVE